MYPLVLPPNLTSLKWAGYSKTQQVLMIANELNRSLNALIIHRPDDAEKGYERAMELTDLTVEDVRWKKALKEILRFRELLSELFLTKNQELNRQILAILLTFDAGAFNMLMPARSDNQN
jgi:hypothetical protein